MTHKTLHPCQRSLIRGCRVSLSARLDGPPSTPRAAGARRRSPTPLSSPAALSSRPSCTPSLHIAGRPAPIRALLARLRCLVRRRHTAQRLAHSGPCCASRSARCVSLCMLAAPQSTALRTPTLVCPSCSSACSPARQCRRCGPSSRLRRASRPACHRPPLVRVRRRSCRLRVRLRARRGPGRRALRPQGSSRSAARLLGALREARRPWARRAAS